MSQEWSRHVTDPDGRDIAFDAGSHMHLAEGRRAWLLDHVDAILDAVERPDFHEDDPLPGRERFYREHFVDSGRWLRAVVDFNNTPGWVVTALEFDEGWNVIQMTLVNLKWILERDGELRITWPDGQVTHDAPSQVLPAAA
jgi:hypothetical protein